MNKFETFRILPGAILCRQGNKEDFFTVMEQPPAVAKYPQAYAEGQRLYVKPGNAFPVSVEKGDKIIPCFLVQTSDILAVAGD